VNVEKRQCLINLLQPSFSKTDIPPAIIEIISWLSRNVDQIYFWEISVYEWKQFWFCLQWHTASHHQGKPHGTVIVLLMSATERHRSLTLTYRRNVESTDQSVYRHISTNWGAAAWTGLRWSLLKLNSLNVPALALPSWRKRFSSRSLRSYRSINGRIFFIKRSFIDWLLLLRIYRIHFSDQDQRNATFSICSKWPSKRGLPGRG